MHPGVERDRHAAVVRTLRLPAPDPEEPAMSRRYDEPIDVRLTDAGPAAFLWRGRIFRVLAVLDRWQERRAWWRDPAPEQDPATGPNAAPDAGIGARAEERERRVWRVEASAGRTDRVGTFDLGADGAAPDGGPRWVLLRAHD